MAEPHRCTRCHQQGKIRDFPNDHNMKAHLGARLPEQPNHNMGPWLCQIAECGLRYLRGDRKSNHPVRRDAPGVPGCPAHQSVWKVDQGLLNALNVEVLACRNLFLAALTPAAAGPAAPAAGHGPATPAPATNNNPAPAAAQGQAGPPVNGQGQVDLPAAIDEPRHEGEAAEVDVNGEPWDRMWPEREDDASGGLVLPIDGYSDDDRLEFWELFTLPE